MRIEERKANIQLSQSPAEESLLESSGEDTDSSESLQPSRSWYKDKVFSLEKEILKMRSRLAQEVDSKNEKRAAVEVPIEVGESAPAGINRSAQSSAEIQKEQLQLKARTPRGLEAKSIEDDALPSHSQSQAHLPFQKNVKRASIYIAVGKDTTRQKVLATMLSAMTSDLRSLITLEIRQAENRKVWPLWKSY